MTEERSRSIWVYVGIGCVSLLVLAIVVMVGVAFVGYRAVKRIESEMKDPVKRTARVHELLGTEKLPEGYWPAFSITIPYVLRLAILADREPHFDEHGKHDKDLFDARGFIYVQTPLGSKDKDLEQILSGEKDLSDLLKPGDVSIESGETVGRGDLQLGEMHVRYVAERGSIRRRRQQIDGLVTLMSIDCSEDEKLRLGIWFGPDPHAGEPIGPGTLDGTPADPEAITGFISHFSLCGG
jgi:hypothetical protein